MRHFKVQKKSTSHATSSKNQDFMLEIVFTLTCKVMQNTNLDSATTTDLHFLKRLATPERKARCKDTFMLNKTNTRLNMNHTLKTQNGKTSFLDPIHNKRTTLPTMDNTTRTEEHDEQDTT
jgi:hypothetical protein